MILTRIPDRLRFWAYIVYGAGSVTLSYLAANGVVGADEIALWTGLGALFGVTAAANVYPVRPHWSASVADVPDDSKGV